MSVITAAEPVVNVHRDPDPASEVVTQARLGDVADVTERIAPPKAWLRLTFRHDGYTGWVMADGFVAGDWPPAGGRLVRIRSLFGNLHAGAGVRTPLLYAAPLGSPLLRKGEDSEGWIPVEVPGALRAFVQAGDVCDGASAWSWTDEEGLRAGLVRQAKALLGLPYRWGGTTPFGIDCSGFVQLSYRLHGIDLPRDVHDQVRDPRLRPVPREDLRPGDLLVFRGASHIGLAVSGREFVHATTVGSPVVQVNAVDDPHWAGVRDGFFRVRVVCPRPVRGAVVA
jgi:hypothetical protein